MTLRIVGTALLVSAAYFVGANIGFLLKLPPMTPSVMWPPNSILTATLLLAPPGRWWVYLLAVLPAHLAVQLQAGWPGPLIAALFVTNCSEALLGAGIVWRFSDAPSRFDTLRRVAVFIVGAVLLGPFLSSYLDAGVVTLLRGEPYWLVWRTRFFSNVLTELALVPTILCAITGGIAWLRGASTRSRLEAALMAVGLITVTVVVFSGPGESLDMPGAPVNALAFLLPFLLVAAVRFGAGGASASILAIAVLAMWAATHGRGPFVGLLVAEGVRTLQIFLSVVGIPLLCLAALTGERRQAERALAERLRFEELLSGLSGAFVHPSSRDMDAAFESWLQRLGAFFGLDRLVLLRLAGDGEKLEIADAWGAPDGALPPGLEVSPLLHKRLVVFSRHEECPGQAALTLPLVAGDRILGGLVFVATSATVEWPDELVQRLRLVAGVFAGVLARKEAEDALRASELMKSAILTSLSSSVAVLDRQGRIIAVNESWTRLAHETGATAGVGGDVGACYLDGWRRAVSQGVPHAADALAGIEGVLAQTRTAFSLEYAWRRVGSEHWFAMSVVPLKWREGGAVVAHTDITERRRVELDAQRSRQELAHFTRVSTMGELTASLAHELNQPLTGILTNAQAAQRFLASTPPDLAELRSILCDIVDDDRRAGEVIQRLRDLLRKRDHQPVLLDLKGLIRDVARLLSSDAIIRNVALTHDFGPEPAVVRGDRVQLQQVVLNILLNAMEAMAEAAGPRALVVRVETAGPWNIQVAVQDTGPGLREGTHHLVFEPFYSTKPNGMGMGLSISRSIIEAHGGSIWASNNAGRGATFRFVLPTPDEARA
jgi:signal transduction histidine kinase/integral membrane sensor domain MASE1